MGDRDIGGLDVVTSNKDWSYDQSDLHFGYFIGILLPWGCLGMSRRYFPWLPALRRGLEVGGEVSVVSRYSPVM